MKRRQALINLSFSIGGIVAMPLWTSCWNRESLPTNHILLTQEQEKLLEEVTDTILPATDIPGAKEIGVHQFVMAIVYDLYDESNQKDFVTLLNNIEARSKSVSGKSFIKNDPSSRLELLTSIESESSAKEDFRKFPDLKHLTIEGFLNSEYYLTKIEKYELVPGRFNGSFPIQHS